MAFVEDKIDALLACKSPTFFAGTIAEVDAWLEDASAAYMLNEWGYGHTNKDVMATVGKENGWGPLESYTEGSLFQKPSAPELRERMIKEFELIKSGF